MSVHVVWRVLFPGLGVVEAIVYRDANEEGNWVGKYESRGPRLFIHPSDIKDFGSKKRAVSWLTGCFKKAMSEVKKRQSK